MHIFIFHHISTYQKSNWNLQKFIELHWPQIFPRQGTQNFCGSHGILSAGIASLSCTARSASSGGSSCNSRMITSSRVVVLGFQTQLVSWDLLNLFHAKHIISPPNQKKKRWETQCSNRKQQSNNQGPYQLYIYIYIIHKSLANLLSSPKFIRAKRPYLPARFRECNFSSTPTQLGLFEVQILEVWDGKTHVTHQLLARFSFQFESHVNAKLLLHNANAMWMPAQTTQTCIHMFN